MASNPNKQTHYVDSKHVKRIIIVLNIFASLKLFDRRYKENETNKIFSIYQVSFFLDIPDKKI